MVGRLMIGSDGAASGTSCLKESRLRLYIWRRGWDGPFFLSEGKEEDNGPGSGCRQIINERLCGNCIIDNLILVLKW